ncbi:MAG TPA: YceD family protein [Candidatus Saccharimonadia bacterium]
MHINVRDFLAESVGYSRAYTISGERPQLESVVLTDDIAGEVTIAHLEGPSVLVKGHVKSGIQLECHRCLRTFSRPVEVKFKQVFAEQPEDDDMPIIDREIDLAPLVEQEILLSLPIKILDRPDCPGIPVPDGNKPATPPDQSLKARARIIKEER